MDMPAIDVCTGLLPYVRGKERLDPFGLHFGLQVGWELQRSLAVLGELVALDFDSAGNPDGLSGDFTDLAGLADTVRKVKPDVIVNAAAHTAVDKAESEPDLARTLNALAPGVLAAEANRIGAWLVHYSTDYVFDGSDDKAWSEGDAKAPLSVYGQTKLEGELAVSQCPRHLTLRTSWVYGLLRVRPIPCNWRLEGIGLTLHTPSQDCYPKSKGDARLSDPR